VADAPDNIIPLSLLDRGKLINTQFSSQMQTRMDSRCCGGPFVVFHSIRFLRRAQIKTAWNERWRLKLPITSSSHFIF
jgi:hypothetical protein